jgi:hypothetical protein
MLTAIPTTFHVLHHMMEEHACWIGEPQVVVNMNVSWLKYAPLWILERLPEVYDRAETFGVAPEEVDRWRLHSLPSVVHYWSDLFQADPAGNAAYFSAARMVARYKHLDAFAERVPALREVYEQAHQRGAAGAESPSMQVFAAFQNL